MESISSHQNPRIKKLIQLHRSRGRQKQNRIAIFGSREIQRAISAGIDPQELFICPQLVSPETLDSIRRLNSGFESVAHSVTVELFEKICFGNRSDGIVMVASRPELSIEKFTESLKSESPLIAIAENIEKPGNLGAILRSVDGAGVDGLIVADPATDWYHPNTIRASLGTCFSVQGCLSDTATVQSWLKRNDFQVIVASLQGAKDFFEFDLTGRTAIVLGNEANGVSDAWHAEREMVAGKLPMLGIADSLNVSAAAAVMFYEARRQRLGINRNA